MNYKCLFFGHKLGELNDSGYPICERCKSHSYYDDWNKSALLMKPIWYVTRKIYQLKFNLSYWYRSTFLGDNLPF